MACELTIILKDSERRYSQKFLVYEPVTFGTITDKQIENAIKEAEENFKGEPEDIIVKAEMIWK